MAECSESDGELFITQSKYSSREVGSDTDNVLSGILDLEECIQRDVSEDLFSDVSLVDEELLSSTLEVENELLRQRFPKPLEEKDLENMVGNTKSKSTESKTRWAVNLFSKWQRARSGFKDGGRFYKPLLEMTNEELVEALSYFIVEVRNESGKEYRPNSIYEIIISIQHHLRASGKFVNFLDDNVYSKLKSVLDAKMKSLSKQGLGIDKKQADVISVEQEEILWSTGILGSDKPQQLLNTMVYLIGLNFALRAGQEHRNLRFGKDSQILFKRDPSGRSYLQYTEDISKTNSGGLQHRKLAPKCTRAYERENKDRCIVSLYSKYINAR